MKKARLYVDPMEEAYTKKYGIMPDMHYIQLWHKYGAAVAGRTVNSNMDTIYKEMQGKWQNASESECPF